MFNRNGFWQVFKFKKRMQLMKILRLSFLILLVSINKIIAQNVSVNIGLDTIDVDRKTVVKLWSDYLHSKPDSLYNNPYWDANDKLKFKSYDLLKSEGYISPSLYYFNLDNNILSIKKTTNGFIIKSLFISRKSGNIFAITNILAIKKNDRFSLTNYQSVYTNDWNIYQVGYIKYHCFPGYSFDILKANIANRFLNKLSYKFGFMLDTINYFICQDCDEVQRVKGYDYVLGMGNGEECAFYDRFNKIVYATSLAGENHQHELVHTINTYFPKSHELLLAGIAAYWGGENAHNGKPLIYHIKRVNDYLKLHPEIDLNKPTDFWQMDEETNPQYVIGALLCDKALRDGGLEKLKRIFSYGLSDEELLLMIEKELNIKKDNLNTYFRSRISDIANKNIFEIIEN